MKKLNQQIKAFFSDLYEGDQKVLVFGEGHPHAELMLIGEAPGEKEVLAGHPFVGKAGKNLDEFLHMSSVSREEIYITNVVKFRPVKLSKAGRYIDRPPTKEEIELFLPWLKREIDEISPRCIVTLGNVPLKALLGQSVTIGAMHGRFHEALGRALFPMYHPASLIYNPSLREVYAQDIMTLAAWRDGQRDD